MNPTVQQAKFTWFYHLCRRNGRFTRDALSDSANTEAIDKEREEVNKRVSGDHKYGSPNCGATTRDFIEIEVYSLPAIFV